MKLATRLLSLLAVLTVAVAAFRLNALYALTPVPDSVLALTYFYDHNRYALWLLAGCAMAVLGLLEMQYHRSLAILTEWLAVLTGVAAFALIAFYGWEMVLLGLRIDRMAIGFASLVIMLATLDILFVKGRNNTRAMAVLAVLAIAGVATWWFPAVNPVQLSVAQQVWRLRSGHTTLRAFDWGYLKLRSGHYGMDALKALERPGARDDIRVAAASVRRYYFGAGQTWGPGIDQTIEQETVFSSMPEPDGKSMPVELLPGQAVPPDLMDDIRFDIGPCHHREAQCKIKLRDANGDGQSEALFIQWVRVHVFARGGDGWTPVADGSACLEDEQDLIAGKFDLRPQHFDDIMIGGHRLVLETGRCGLLPWGNAMAADFALQKPEPGKVAQARVLFPVGGRVPANFIKAIESGNFAPDRLSGSHFTWTKAESAPYPPPNVAPYQANMPHCPTSPPEGPCRVVLMDLDHDGQPEILAVPPAFSSNINAARYHDLTLFKFDGQRWHATAKGEICEEWGNLDKLTFAAVKPKWFALHINDHDLPLGKSNCQGHGIALP